MPMREFLSRRSWPIMAWRHKAALLSAAWVTAALLAYAFLGLSYGIDFRGGTLVQVRFAENDPSIQTLRRTLEDGGIENFVLQTFGSEDGGEYLITLPPERLPGERPPEEVLSSAPQTQPADLASPPETNETTPADPSEPDTLTEAPTEAPTEAQIEPSRGSTSLSGGSTAVTQELQTLLRDPYPSLEIRRVETVGPKVGDELRLAALKGIGFALLAILVYGAVRFQWRFSLGAVAALVHDILVVLLALILAGIEISLPVVAAILTVAGYSINDSIVIFDRVRENMRRIQKEALERVFDLSLNQTLSRTLLTSATTLCVVMALFVFGGEIIADFAFTLLIGVLVGTYSSLFVAAPVGYALLERFPPKQG